MTSGGECNTFFEYEEALQKMKSEKSGGNLRFKRTLTRVLQQEITSLRRSTVKKWRLFPRYKKRNSALSSSGTSKEAEAAIATFALGTSKGKLIGMIRTKLYRIPRVLIICNDL